MNRFLSLSFALATTLLATSAAAAPRHIDEGNTAAFRSQGSVIISVTNGGGAASSVGDSSPTTLLFWGHTSGDSLVDPGDPNRSTARSSSRFILTPALDYFIIDGLSLGGELLYARHTDSFATTNSGTTVTTDSSGTAFGFAPRIGYDAGLTESLSLWIRGGFGYFRDGSDGSGNGGSTSSSVWTIGADVQLLWHVHPHFFVGVGPGVSRELSSSTTSDNGRGVTVTTDVGKNTHWRFLSFTIGGAF